VDPVRHLVEQRPDFFENRAADLDEAVRINDFIYMSTGLSNSYMLMTGAGRIIINTGMGFEAPTHKRVFDAVCPGPTPYVILTQGHVDHVGGVSLFRESCTRVIAQRNNGVCQRDDERIRGVRQAQAYIWFKAAIDAGTRRAGAPRSAYVQDTPTPDILFEDGYALELGGLRLELLWTPGGETIDSCVVWLPEQRILFSGNAFGPLFPHFPNINTLRGDKYRFIEPYLEAVRRIRALGPDILITGHFEPIQGRELIAQCLDRLEAAVDYVHSETLKGMNEGRDIWSLMRDIRLPDALYVGQGYGKVSWAVRTIWESYMGWFKAEATTELYPTQPREIYPILVELAGIEAVVERGLQSVRSDPEAALLLAEAALAADGDHAGAIGLAIEAHEAILQRSGGDNFWEKGWLDTAIADLRARREKLTAK